MIWMCFCCTREWASESATVGLPCVSSKVVTILCPSTVLPKTLSPRFQPSSSCLAGAAAVPVSGTSYPTLIGLPALEPVPEEVLELQAAATRDEAASTSINTCNRRGRRVALMTFSVPGNRGQGQVQVISLIISGRRE